MCGITGASCWRQPAIVKRASELDRLSRGLGGIRDQRTWLAARDERAIGTHPAICKPLAGVGQATLLGDGPQRTTRRTDHDDRRSQGLEHSAHHRVRDRRARGRVVVEGSVRLDRADRERVALRDRGQLGRQDVVAPVAGGCSTADREIHDRRDSGSSHRHGDENGADRARCDRTTIEDRAPRLNEPKRSYEVA